MRSRILLIYTGGTIGMNRNPHTGALEPFDFEHLLLNVPELKQFDIKIDTYQFEPPIDSSDMSPAMWTDISHCIADHYDDYDGFVVLHGTDTMAYTASALSYMLENLTKPVIFTGSQLPIGQLRTDGKENLITAVEIAAAQGRLPRLQQGKAVDQIRRAEDPAVTLGHTAAAHPGQMRKKSVDKFRRVAKDPAPKLPELFCVLRCGLAQYGAMKIPQHLSHSSVPDISSAGTPACRRASTCAEIPDPCRPPG